MKNENVNKTVSMILKMIPLAMSVAVVVLSILQQITADTGVIMLAVGMFCGALERMRQQEK